MMRREGKLTATANSGIGSGNLYSAALQMWFGKEEGGNGRVRGGRGEELKEWRRRMVEGWVYGGGEREKGGGDGKKKKKIQSMPSFICLLGFSLAKQ